MRHTNPEQASRTTKYGYHWPTCHQEGQVAEELSLLNQDLVACGRLECVDYFDGSRQYEHEEARQFPRNDNLLPHLRPYECAMMYYVVELVGAESAESGAAALRLLKKRQGLRLRAEVRAVRLIPVRDVDFHDMWTLSVR
jgi:hypothetical protein